MKDYQLGSTDLIVSLTAAGRPQAEVADAAGISVRTLRRRLQEPQIVVAVSAAVVQLEKEAVGRLGQLRRRAFDQLETLLLHEDPAVVLRTCRLVLDAGLALSRAGFDGVHQATEDQGWQHHGSTRRSFGSERSG